MSIASKQTMAAQTLGEPLKLPCGKVAPNRIAKAPLEEMLANSGVNLPNEGIFHTYRTWSEGGWGIIITGNICLDRTHLGTPNDVAMPNPGSLSKESKKAFREYAASIKGKNDSSSPLAIAQLVHAGRQSMRGSGRAPWKPALAPSAVPVRASGMGPIGRVLDWALFGTCVEMTKEQIADLVERFAAASEVLHEAGFDGIEIHASHGYQIAAFLSPRTNLRTDEYGRDARGRVRLLLEIVDAVRKRVPSTFAVGVKLNSSDYIQGGLTEEDALTNVQWLAEHGGVDFVEISGGNYENPSFVSSSFNAETELARVTGKPLPSKRTVAREAFFQGFAQRARESVQKSDSKMALILTGGLRTRGGMAAPVQDGIVDGVALGRYACVYPHVPRTILDTNIADNDALSSPPKYEVRGDKVASYIPLKLIGAGWMTLWHVAMIAQISRNEKPNPQLSPVRIVLSVFAPSLARSGRTLVALFLAVLVGLVSLVRVTA